jgi:hypothetical protein
MEQSSKVILFREVTPKQAVSADKQYVLIVGDPAYTDFYVVYGPFDTAEAASAWSRKIDDYSVVKELDDPNKLQPKDGSN